MNKQRAIIGSFVRRRGAQFRKPLDRVAARRGWARPGWPPDACSRHPFGVILLCCSHLSPADRASGEYIYFDTRASNPERIQLGGGNRCSVLDKEL
jgi:hypothetical protein